MSGKLRRIWGIIITPRTPSAVHGNSNFMSKIEAQDQDVPIFYKTGSDGKFPYKAKC